MFSLNYKYTMIRNWLVVLCADRRTEEESVSVKNEPMYKYCRLVLFL